MGARKSVLFSHNDIDTSTRTGARNQQDKYYSRNICRPSTIVAPKLIESRKPKWRSEVECVGLAQSSECSTVPMATSLS